MSPSQIALSTYNTLEVSPSNSPPSLILSWGCVQTGIAGERLHPTSTNTHRASFLGDSNATLAPAAHGNMGSAMSTVDSENDRGTERTDMGARNFGEYSSPSYPLACLPAYLRARPHARLLHDEASWR